MLRLICAFMTASCSVVEIGGVIEDGTDGAWVAPGISPPQSARSITFVSAFDYPDGYRWSTDQEEGSVRCSLVVFMDEIPIMKVPVGNEYKVSSDPDMHRLIDGHLYTDFSTDSETLIKKDGKLLFSYPQPETIYDFKIINGSVHTLGQSRRGDGFSYRVDGEVVLQRETGYSFGRIMCRDSVVSVSFVQPIRVEDGLLERYYIIRDGVVSQIAVREDIKKVWDVVCHNGEVYYLASLTGVSLPVIVSEREMTALSMPHRSSLVDCRICLMEAGIGVEGVISRDGDICAIIWDSAGNYKLYPEGMTISALCLSEDAVHFAMNPTPETREGIIVRSGESMMMPAGYACMSRGAADFSSGLLSIGLSSLSGSRPLLWKDGDCVELDVNGYISSVSSIMVDD